MQSRILLLLLCAFTALAQQPRRVVMQGTINEPGQYVLAGDMQVVPSRGAGIMITASGVDLDVDLDLNGANLSGPGGIQGTAIHVRGASGVSIRNGKLANLQIGINGENSANVTVCNIQFSGQALMPTGMPETAVMIMQSRNVVVENNSVYNMPLGLFVRGGNSSGNRIANNTLTTAIGSFAAFGICYNPTPTDTRGPRADLIYGNHISGYPTAIQMNSTSRANAIKENVLMFSVEAIATPPDNLDMDNVKVKLP